MSENNNVREPSDYREWHKNDKKVLNYEYNLYAEDSYVSYLWELEKGILLKEISLIRKTEIRYLDFACGTGRILSFIEEHVAESTGVDVSENMLNIAKSKVKKSQILNSDLTTDDIIEKKQYDLITAFRFFLNAQEDLKGKVMCLLSEKLSNDGLFIFNNHGNTFSYYLWPVILGWLGIKQEKLNHLSYFNIMKHIRNSNLRVKRIYGIGFIPASFYRWLNPWRKFFMHIDKALSNCRLTKLFARDIIFVCTKK